MRLNIRLAILGLLLVIAMPFAADAGQPLNVGDEIRVDVAGESDLCVSRLIDDMGAVDLPLVGKVTVAGAESAEAASRIRALYDDGFLRDPKITVTRMRAAVTGRAQPITRGAAPLPAERLPAVPSVVAEPLGAMPVAAAQPPLRAGTARARIAGQVIDARTRRPIAKALLTAGATTVYSSARGEFVIDLPVGTTETDVKAVIAGYQPSTHRVSCALGPVAGLEILLSPHGADLPVAGVAPRRGVPAVTAAPAGVQPITTAPVLRANSNRTIEIIDGRSGKPVTGAAMLMSGRVFQVNRLGQIDLSPPYGDVLVMADGYQVLQGAFDAIVRNGDTDRIVLEPVPLAREIVVWVRDGATRLPLKGAVVEMAGSKVTVGGSGRLTIRDINTEFGELVIKKRGYRTTRQILDFKEGGDREILLLPGD